jgi:hypothetical protein
MSECVNGQFFNHLIFKKKRTQGLLFAWSKVLTLSPNLASPNRGPPGGAVTSSGGRGKVRGGRSGTGGLWLPSAFTSSLG